MESNSPNTPTPIKPKKSSSIPIIILVVAILVLLAAALVGVLTKDKKTNTPSANSQPGQTTDTGRSVNPIATLAIDPDSGNAVQNKTLTVSVYEDSKDQTANAVQANLTYPTDKFEFVSIDSSESAFGVTAESKGGDGKITIARGAVKPVTGKQLVAKVTFKVLDANGEGKVTFSTDSDVISSVDNKSLLSSSESAVFSLKAE